MSVQARRAGRPADGHPSVGSAGPPRAW